MRSEARERMREIRLDILSSWEIEDGMSRPLGTTKKRRSGRPSLLEAKRVLAVRLRTRINSKAITKP